MSLSKYQKKRNFKKTPEPKGNVSSSKKKSKLAYVIQKHAASHLHYDFRLELKGVLLSWAVPKGPCLDPSVKRLAMHVEDHPLEYGSFEGTIPKGQYGGGTVMLWDKGEWIPEDDNPYSAYKKGSLKFSLKGEKLQGSWKLIKMHDDDKTWLLIKAKDDYAVGLKQHDITETKPNSVTTYRTMDEISKNKATSAPFPQEFFPQLATLVDKPPEGEKWLHEIKFDGYRILAIKKNNKTRLLTRNNNDWTNKFASIANAINRLPIKNIILDGEIVVLDENNKSDFQALQNALSKDNNAAFIYYVFDLPYYDKFDLTHIPLLDRKNKLRTLLPEDNELIRYNEHIVGSGKALFSEACKLSLEGIISKDANSEYTQTRSKSWLKIKCTKRQEFVVGGYTKAQGARNHFGSLLIGTYNKNNELVYNGHVGTGFTATSLKNVYNQLVKLKSKVNPFLTKPPNVKQVSWVKPTLIVEVEFTEWTKYSILRHPSFKGIRKDKSPKSIIKESVKNLDKVVTKSAKKAKSPTYKLTHPDKLLYPEDKLTKKNLAEYYESIQDWILPHIINRPLMLVRCPENYRTCFYQKHITPSLPDALLGISIREKNKTLESIYINDAAGVLSLAQLGVLEIHPWGSQIKQIEYPDMIIFDLDPAPTIKWQKVVEAAFEIKQQLAEFKLRSFIKTTGGKGLHVVVPIKPEYDWEQVKNFSHVFVDFLVSQNPKKYISKMSKIQRKGKIFIDYLRNQRGATAVAPYSLRARIHAPVATPIDWDELTNNIKDTQFTIKTLGKRLIHLSEDPWKDFYKIKQSLKIIDHS